MIIFSSNCSFNKNCTFVKIKNVHNETTLKSIKKQMRSIAKNDKILNVSKKLKNAEK